MRTDDPHAIQTSTFGVSVNPMPCMITPRDGDGWHSTFMSPNEARVHSGVRVSPKTVIGYPPIWRALNLISGRVAGLDFNAYKVDKKGGLKEDRTVPGRRLVRKQANSRMRAYTWIRSMTSHAVLYGNGISVINRGSRNQPVELILLDPQNVLIHEFEDELWYGTYRGSDVAWFPGSDIVHIRGLTHDGIVGNSLIKLCADALGVGIAGQQFAGNFFGNNATMAGLLMIPGHFDEAKARRTIDTFNHQYKGVTKSWRVGLLQDGAKFQQLSVSPSEGQFLESRNFEIRSVVSNLCGIPPHLLGDDSRTSHSSLEMETQSLLDNCLAMHLEEWESECDTKLLTKPQRDRETHHFKFDDGKVIRLAVNDKVNADRKRIEMGFSINDICRRDGKPTIGPDGDRRFIPANLIPIDRVDDMIDRRPAIHPSQAADSSPSDSPEKANNSNGNMALRSMVAGVVDKHLTLEHDRLCRQAKRGVSGHSLAVFYDRWVDCFSKDLSGIANTEVLSEHVNRRLVRLHDIWSSSVDTTLVSNIEAELQGTRAGCVTELTDRILDEVYK